MTVVRRSLVVWLFSLRVTLATGRFSAIFKKGTSRFRCFAYLFKLKLTGHHDGLVDCCQEINRGRLQAFCTAFSTSVHCSVFQVEPSWARSRTIRLSMIVTELFSIPFTYITGLIQGCFSFGCRQSPTYSKASSSRLSSGISFATICQKRSQVAQSYGSYVSPMYRIGSL